MISDFLGSFLTPPPPYLRFSSYTKGFLYRESPIFENLPPSLKSDIIYGRPLIEESFPKRLHNGYTYYVEGGKNYTTYVTINHTF